MRIVKLSPSHGPDLRHPQRCPTARAPLPPSVAHVSLLSTAPLVDSLRNRQTMPTHALDNYLTPLVLGIDHTEVEGFLSEHGVANFLNIPYARVPVRFRTAVPVPTSDLSTSLDASRYGPKCPQKSDPLQQSMSHVFEEVSLAQAADEVNCLHLNIYCPPTALDSVATSKLPVFAWIHGGAFNMGDNSTQFGKACGMSCRYAYSRLTLI
jgi:hypothetical protein